MMMNKIELQKIKQEYGLEKIIHVEDVDDILRSQNIIPNKYTKHMFNTFVYGEKYGKLFRYVKNLRGISELTKRDNPRRVLTYNAIAYAGIVATVIGLNYLAESHTPFESLTQENIKSDPLEAIILCYIPIFALIEILVTVPAHYAVAKLEEKIFQKFKSS